MHLTPNQELFFDLNITFICHNMIESPHLKVLIFCLTVTFIIKDQEFHLIEY